MKSFFSKSYKHSFINDDIFNIDGIYLKIYVKYNIIKVIDDIIVGKINESSVKTIIYSICLPKNHHYIIEKYPSFPEFFKILLVKYGYYAELAYNNEPSFEIEMLLADNGLTYKHYLNHENFTLSIIAKNYLIQEECINNLATAISNEIDREIIKELKKYEKFSKKNKNRKYKRL